MKKWRRMAQVNAYRLAELRKIILPLEGLSHKPGHSELPMYWGPIASAFPQHRFPVGAVHEFICDHAANAAATAGFISAITGQLMQDGGATAWISCQRDVFPSSLTTFGIAPHQLIFIQLQKEKDLLWAAEEALKCNGMAAVIAEINQLNFMQSRRLQLAVEQSAVTGFIFRRKIKSLQTTSCVSRWQITSVESALNNDLPGLGYPRWKIDLLKIRGGIPGSWIMEWRNNQLHEVDDNIIIPYENAVAAQVKRKAV